MEINITIKKKLKWKLKNNVMQIIAMSETRISQNVGATESFGQLVAVPERPCSIECREYVIL
jgi:hypothetical protein